MNYRGKNIETQASGFEDLPAFRRFCTFLCCFLRHLWHPLAPHLPGDFRNFCGKMNQEINLKMTWRWPRNTRTFPTFSYIFPGHWHLLFAQRQCWRSRWNWWSWEFSDTGTWRWSFLQIQLLLLHRRSSWSAYEFGFIDVSGWSSETKSV